MESGKRLALSDRLNTVLARDVQQMLNGRAFLADALEPTHVRYSPLRDEIRRLAAARPREDAGGP